MRCVFYLIDKHSEKSQQAWAAIVFQTALIAKLLHKDAVGGHARILQLRKTAGLSFFCGAGTAERTAAGTYHEAGGAFRPKFLHKGDGGFVMDALGLLDGRNVGIVADFPNGLQHQCLFILCNTLFHILAAAAARWAGMIGTVLPA